MERFIANGWAPECCFSSMWVASDSLNIFLPFVVFLRTVDTFFFDHLTPVCLLVIEALNSIAFTFLDDPSYEIPRELTTPYTGMEEELEVCHMLVGEIIYTVATQKDLLSYYIISHVLHGRRWLYTSVRFLLIYQTLCRAFSPQFDKSSGNLYLFV